LSQLHFVCLGIPKISRPEFFWVITHPFIAKKTLKISKEVLTTTLTIKKERSLDTLISGGNLDAFKHSYWMARLASEIGKKKALKLGKAHEKGNYLQFKKHKKEDGQLPDSISTVMDLWNNKLGVEIYLNNKNKDKEILKASVLEAVKLGKAKVLKTNSKYEFLDCDNNVINLELYKGTWNVPKCLINSGRLFQHKFF
jgi:hypothetical protein